MIRVLPVFLLLTAACSGGAGSDSPGGFVRLEHRRAVSGAEATFARAEFSNVPPTRPGRGRCEVPETASDGAWRDVGDTILLARDGAQLLLPRATLGSLVVYGADGLPASASPIGEKFDVTLSGTGENWENAIEVPALLEPGEIVNQIGFSADQPFSWAPSDVEEVLLEIGSGGVDLVCRATGKDGGLVIPLEQNAELSSTGGMVTYRAIHRRHATLDGHAIALEGQSVVIVPYE